MSETCHRIVEMLVSDMKDKFDINEEDLESLEKEWFDVITEILHEEGNTKCSPCVECGNILCQGDLC